MSVNAVVIKEKITRLFPSETDIQGPLMFFYSILISIGEKLVSICHWAMFTSEDSRCAEDRTEKLKRDQLK